MYIFNFLKLFTVIIRYSKYKHYNDYNKYTFFYNQCMCFFVGGRRLNIIFNRYIIRLYFNKKIISNFTLK